MSNVKSIKKLIAISILSLSILSINPICANAEWKQDSNGWWNTEGDSWSTGWRQIDNKWYYFDNNGYMVTNTTINGYKIDNSGVWVQNTAITTTNNSNNVATTNLTSNSNNVLNSNNTTNLTNLTNNINNGVIINGNIAIGNNTNSNNTQQSNNNNDEQINSNDYNKTEPIIQGKFTDKENNIFPCWAIIEGRYYHLDGDKQIDYNTIVDGYQLGSDGAWLQDNSINPPKAIILPYGFQLNAEQMIEKLQMETKSNNIKQELKSDKHNDRTERIKELQNKIADIQNRHTNNGDYWIQIYQNEIRELQLEDQSNS